MSRTEWRKFALQTASTGPGERGKTYTERMEVTLAV